MFNSSFKRISTGYLAAAILCQGCTSWVDNGSFQRSEQTLLTVNSVPNGEVFINNRLIGSSDVTIPLDYSQRVSKKTRDVNYWVTQPGWSLFFTLISVGVYLPFSFVPADSETTLTPTGEFSDNEFDIAVESQGFERWSQHLTCRGEDSQSVSANLVPISSSSIFPQQ